MRPSVVLHRSDLIRQSFCCFWGSSIPLSLLFDIRTSPSSNKVFVRSYTTFQCPNSSSQSQGKVPEPESFHPGLLASFCRPFHETTARVVSPKALHRLWSENLFQTSQTSRSSDSGVAVSRRAAAHLLRLAEPELSPGAAS